MKQEKLLDAILKEVLSIRYKMDEEMITKDDFNQTVYEIKNYIDNSIGSQLKVI